MAGVPVGNPAPTTTERLDCSDSAPNCHLTAGATLVKPVLVVVSVAADRTPADVSAFVTHVNWRPGWHWLLGNQAALQAVWSTWSFVLNGTDVVHQEIAHVINKHGKVVASYNAPYYPAELAATITAEWAK